MAAKPVSQSARDDQGKAPRTSGSPLGGWMFVILAVLVVGVVYWMTHRTQSSVEQEQAQLTQTNQYLQNKVTQLENDLSDLKGTTQQQRDKLNAIPDALYRIEPVGTNDLRISRTAIAEGKEEVLVASVKAAAGFTGARDGVELFVALPRERTIVLRRFRTGPGADEALPFDYWKFDTDTLKFSEYNEINVYDKEHLTVAVLPSPDKKLIAFVNLDEERDGTGSSRHIGLLNVVSGMFNPSAVTINEGQTLNALYSYPGLRYSLEWKSNELLSYSTYDQTKADTKSRTEKPLVMSAQVTLK